MKRVSNFRNMFGNLGREIEVVAADGAIAIPPVDTTYFITKGTACAMTLVDPIAVKHDGRRLTFFSTTAAAHTLSNAAGSGFNGAGSGSDVGTFGAAVANYLTIEAYNGKWYEMENHNVTLG